MFYQNKDFINNMIRLIRECNEIILDVYNKDFKVIKKKDDSPLTIADENCNKRICNFLENFNLENSVIISEEIKNLPYKERKDAEWCWLIDPLDGTKEFVKKNGEFTVNIGLCRKGVPVFGIVSVPVTGEIYYGSEGIGSYKVVGEKSEKLYIEEKDLSKDNLKIVTSSSHMNDTTKQYICRFNKPIILNVGSSIKLLQIAEGKAELYPRLSPTSEWDTCAAHAIVKYANGTVVKCGSNDELEYNKPDLLNPFFISY